MTNKSTYPLDYAIERVRQAIDHAEVEGDFQKVRLVVKDLEESIQAELGNQLLIDQIADAKDQEDTNRSIISTFYPF